MNAIIYLDLAELMERDLERLLKKLKEAQSTGNKSAAKKLVKEIRRLHDLLDWC